MQSVAIWHPSMLGFNVTAQTYSYDNRPVVPLYSMPFSQWWMHNHLDHPPHPEDVLEFEAGGSTDIEISCDKGYTTFFSSSEGGSIQDPNSDLCCPGQPVTAIHANNIDDTAGCALGIAYKSDFNDVQPEDFVIFSVVHTCPWFLKNTFQVPDKMPACPNDNCICGFFWIHNPDSGGEQMYMNGFQCRITGDIGTQPIGKPGLARQCGADAASGHPANPSNCTIGPKNPMYWDQAEGNNMFEGIYDAPTYNDRYGFPDGAQPNLFQDATVGGTPATVQNNIPPSTSASSALLPSSSAPASASEGSTPSSSFVAPSSDSSASAPSSSVANPSTTSVTPSPTTSVADSLTASATPSSTASVAPPPPPPSDSTTSPSTISSVTAPSSSPLSSSAETAVTPSTSVVPSPITAAAASGTSAPTTSAPAPASTKQCRSRNGKKKRSAVQRHLKKRLSHDGHYVSH
ncbi:uncharacterized protein PHACADRAFT_89092 [Phanerochaete carnosa HHB-10118-sp]|uniref:Lytic polysaccharide monooxygenase n=1 Tax=Phanerochaete carnosa (strain HHB-10118-sp) TaxID=650164 RepID=K5WGL0_PHACS|nr:uncharacterized protein PHACADRAFT_89092 [Phanerochaete carnosa HHB-10118-sp]EKM58455.1 hypothetical protein PHACADRAFT_89092 [Phanerochaete carnosa HHB-10118-sp]